MNNEEDDFMYMSDMLEGKVSEAAEPSPTDLTQNVVMVTLAFDNERVFIAILTYYRQDGDVIELETECEIPRAGEEVAALSQGKTTVRLLEVDRGDTNMFKIEDSLAVEGTFMSGFDVAKGRVLFGLKLRKIKPSVL